jgi:hypothetical protein
LKLLFLDFLKVIVNFLYFIVIAQTCSNESAAARALFELYFLRFIPVHPLVKAGMFKDMLAVLQLNKSGIWFIFCSKKYLCDLIVVTHTAQFGALVTTKTNAWMATFTKLFRARHVTSWTIAQLSTLLSTLQVLAAPLAGLSAWLTRFIAAFRALTMKTVVGALLLTGRAFGWTGRVTHMPTY